MSYDIRLVDPTTKNTIQFDNKHEIKGGNYVAKGTTEAWLNVTYNYSQHFYKVMGDKGIRTIYGKTGAEAIPILKDAISKLANDTDLDYWKPTEGNAKQALCGLLAFAQLRPDGVFQGD
jgi:hypothetical protein